MKDYKITSEFQREADLLPATVGECKNKKTTGPNMA